MTLLDDPSGMINIRKLQSIAPGELVGLCDVLIDSVEGGASVNFMLPMSRTKAWRVTRLVEKSKAI